MQALRGHRACSAAAHTCRPPRVLVHVNAVSRSSRAIATRKSSIKQPVATDVLALGAVLSACLAAEPAFAFTIQAEPANALSLPTWAVHVSSVAEWVLAMGLFWKYAEVSGNERWKGMTWGMLPCLGSAMAACTWHFFYNSPDLEFLVALQAALTVVGNCTCWIAAYRIYQGAKEAAS